VAVAESSNGKYWFDVREVNLNRINSKSLLLVRIVPDLFILETLQTVSPLLSKQVMDNRPHSGNVWGIHIDIKKSTNSAFLFNIKNPSKKIATKLLKNTEINQAFDTIKKVQSMSDRRVTAMRLMDQSRFSEALPIFLDLIDDNPNDEPLHYMAGQCFRFTNNPSKAVQFLSKAASIDPTEPSVFLALGIAYQLDDDFHSAIKALEHAIDLSPNLFTAYNSIGLTYRKLGMFQKAIDWYTKAGEGMVSEAIEEVRKHPEKCYKDEIIDGKKVRKMLPYYMNKLGELLKANLLYSVMLNNIGVCFIELGDLDAAREKFNQSIEMIPEDSDYNTPFENLDGIS
jgi:tetratricopeptide (TPR) repeat protein